MHRFAKLFLLIPVIGLLLPAAARAAEPRKGILSDLVADSSYLTVAGARFRNYDAGPIGWGGRAGIYSPSPWQDIDWGFEGTYDHSNRTAPRFKRTDYSSGVYLRWWAFGQDRRGYEIATPYLFGGVSAQHVNVDAILDNVAVRHSGWRPAARAGAGARFGPFQFDAWFNYVQHWSDYSPSTWGTSLGVVLPLK